MLVELDPAADGVWRCLAAVEHTAGRGSPFRWAVVGADAVAGLAAGSGLVVTHTWRCDGRAFAELRT